MKTHWNCPVEKLTIILIHITADFNICILHTKNIWHLSYEFGNAPSIFVHSSAHLVWMCLMLQKTSRGKLYFISLNLWQDVSQRNSCSGQKAKLLMSRFWSFESEINIAWRIVCWTPASHFTACKCPRPWKSAAINYAPLKLVCCGAN